MIHPVYRGDGLYALLGHLLFYKMFDENIMFSFGYHFWFLSTIIQFYLIFPLIIVIEEKLGILGCAATALLVSISYWITMAHFDLNDGIYNILFPQYLWECSAGILFAKYYKDKNKSFWDQNRILLLFLAVMGILAMALMAIKGGRIGRTFNDIPASIGYVSLSALLFSISSSSIQPLKRFFILVGKSSYELYLTHMIIFLLLRDLIETITNHKSNIFISLLLILPAAIVSSCFIHRLFSRLLAKIQPNHVQQIN